MSFCLRGLATCREKENTYICGYRTGSVRYMSKAPNTCIQTGRAHFQQEWWIREGLAKKVAMSSPWGVGSRWRWQMGRRAQQAAMVGRSSLFWE